MPEWGRDTPWRQGSLLSATDLQATGVISDGSGNGVVGVVVSHDCDIAQGTDLEPEIEVIVATVNPTINGNYSHGKSSRALQVNAELNGQPSVVTLELLAPGKRKIQKALLIAAKPAGAIQAFDREILQRWLASRYRRSAFADEFNNRLKDTGLKSKLESVLKKYPQHISGVYFLIDDGEAVEHKGEDDPYALLIYLLYPSEPDPAVAAKFAAEASAKIKADFQSKCCCAGTWKNFELIDCAAISDAALTFAKVNQLQRWHADHLSFRVTPPGGIDDGEGVTAANQ